MSACPPHYIETDSNVGSNLDLSCDHALAERMKTEHIWAGHSAWDWWGKVWWAGGQYHIECWRHRCPRGVLSDECIDDLLREARSQWGGD